MIQIRTALRTAGAVKLEELAIDKSHAWAVFLDIYVLDADGCLLDVCLLAAVAALLGLQLPRVEVNDQGQVRQCSRSARLVRMRMNHQSTRHSSGHACGSWSHACNTEVYGGLLWERGDPQARFGRMVVETHSCAARDAGGDKASLRVGV